MTTARLAISMCLFAVMMASMAEEKNAVSIVGEYTLISGKKLGMKVDGAALKGKYIIEKDKIIIESETKFVIGYKISTKAKPAHIDLEILEGPEGTKGEKSLGIVERTGDDLKLTYSLEKGMRPKDFDEKEAMSFLFKIKGK